MTESQGQTPGRAGRRSSTPSGSRPESPNRRRPPAWLRWLARDFTIISLVYTAAWGLLLINGGRYWDDWCMVEMSFPTARLMGSMIGQVWQPLYWMMLSWVPGANYIAHWLIFACYLASALLLNRILRATPGIDRSARVLIPCLFAVFPVNGARFALVNFQYAISVAAFYFATYLIVRDFDEPRLRNLIASGLLYFGALITTNSLMAYLALVPLYICTVRWRDLRSWKTVEPLLSRYGFVLAMPFAAYIVRSTLLQPWGLYANYNEVGQGGFSAAWQMVGDTAATSFTEPLLSAGAIGLAVAIPVFALLYLTRFRFVAPVHVSLFTLGFGLTAFVLGVYPYLAVGKIPQAVGIEGWDSRHQLLVPLGAALVLYSVIGLIGRIPHAGRIVALGLVSVVLGACIVTDVTMSLAYQADWYKQISLMKRISRTPVLRTENVFAFDDKTLVYNANARKYQFYEYTGMMYEVFGDAKRFGTEAGLVPAWGRLIEQYRPYKQYHYWDTAPPYRSASLTVKPGTQDVTDPRVVGKLLWLQLFAPKEFDRRVLNVVTLEVNPQ